LYLDSLKPKELPPGTYCTDMLFDLATEAMLFLYYSKFDMPFWFELEDIYVFVVL